MDSDIWLVVLGGLLGCIVGMFIGAAIFMGEQPSLNDCAKENNVYKCELVAVPVTTN